MTLQSSHTAPRPEATFAAGRNINTENLGHRQILVMTAGKLQLLLKALASAYACEDCYAWESTASQGAVCFLHLHTLNSSVMLPWTAVISNDVIPRTATHLSPSR